MLPFLTSKNVTYVIKSKDTLYKVTTQLLYNGKVRQEVAPQIIYETNSLMFLVFHMFIIFQNLKKKEVSLI